MLILLCGVDGGGKSTLADTLCQVNAKHGPARVIHTGPPLDPTEDVFADYELPFQGKEFLEEIISDQDLVVLDRWHLGDRIYGPRYRGFARYTDGGLLHTEMVLSSLGVVKVICSPPLEVVQKRVANRGDDYIDFEDLPRIHAEYVDHGERYGYHFYDGLYGSAQVAHHFINRARYLAGKAKVSANASASTYTGSLHPEFIIAGDELGGTPTQQARRGGFIRPFTPNSSATSSEWLMSAIYQTGYLNTIGLVNVNHPGVDVPQLASALYPQATWVALGDKASATLAAYEVSHQRIQHPAYAKRFRNAYHGDYITQLKEALVASR